MAVNVYQSFLMFGITKIGDNIYWSSTVYIIYAQCLDFIVNNLLADLRWYKKSAEQSYAISQFNLALMFYNGDGTTADKKQAAFWMREAYENGCEGVEEEWNKLELWKY